MIQDSLIKELEEKKEKKRRLLDSKAKFFDYSNILPGECVLKRSSIKKGYYNWYLVFKDSFGIEHVACIRKSDKNSFTTMGYGKVETLENYKAGNAAYREKLKREKPRLP